MIQSAIPRREHSKKGFKVRLVWGHFLSDICLVKTVLKSNNTRDSKYSILERSYKLIGWLCIVEIRHMDIISPSCHQENNDKRNKVNEKQDFCFYVVVLKIAVLKCSWTFTRRKKWLFSFTIFLFYKAVGRGHTLCEVSINSVTNKLIFADFSTICKNTFARKKGPS